MSNDPVLTNDRSGDFGHQHVRMQVWALIDAGIAAAVRTLMEMPGVLTHTSCEGTERYRPYVMVTWENDAARARIAAQFDFTEEGDHWAYAHPRGTHAPSESR